MPLFRRPKKAGNSKARLSFLQVMADDLIQTQELALNHCDVVKESSGGHTAEQGTAGDSGESSCQVPEPVTIRISGPDLQ